MVPFGCNPVSMGSGGRLGNGGYFAGWHWKCVTGGEFLFVMRAQTAAGTMGWSFSDCLEGEYG